MSVTIANDNIVTIDQRELKRLQSVEKVWSEIFFALKACNPDCFLGARTGAEGALREIVRLQQIEKLVACITPGA